ncbi:MAG: aminoacetone oxidase family FAD-binding enzyme [Oscillospiraceae bacterium]
MITAIIGGGAAGMMAALTASGIPGCRVILLERADRLGRKLSVTGNGRCNITNTDLAPYHYHGSDPDFVLPALRRFGLNETLEFFRSLGLITVTEPSGRVYPHSDQAGSVVDVMRLSLGSRNVDVRTGAEVYSAKKEGRLFTVRLSNGVITCDRLIIACGGLAGTRAGGSASGYELLKSFGHRCSKLYPSLVQLKTDNVFTRPLKGVRADAQVSVIENGRELASSAGEVQFTDYGVSGPTVFEVSRAASFARGNVIIRLDLMRGLSEAELIHIMRSRLASQLTLENLLTGVLHNKLGRTVISRCGYSLACPAKDLRDEDLAKIAALIKCCDLKLLGTTGMDGAQVTAGGILTNDFNPYTLESRLVSGLYAAGEVLDIDGDCGGYNLQWAWSSGHTAGLLSSEAQK